MMDVKDEAVVVKAEQNNAVVMRGTATFLVALTVFRMRFPTRSLEWLAPTCLRRSLRCSYRSRNSQAVLGC